MVLSLGVLEFGLDDHTLRVVGERARLQRDYVLALYRLGHEQVRRLHVEGFEHLVGVLPTVCILDKDLVTHHDIIYVPKGEEARSIRVPEAMPGDVHVGLFLPREARAVEVDAGRIPERILIVAERIRDGEFFTRSILGTVSVRVSSDGA